MDLSLTIAEEDKGAGAHEAEVPPKSAVKTMQDKKVNDRPKRTATAKAGIPSPPPVPRIKLTPKPTTSKTPEVRLRQDANANLVRKVKAMSDPERQKEIERLNALPDMELRWENSDANMANIFRAESETASVMPVPATPPTTTTSTSTPDSTTPPTPTTTTRDLETQATPTQIDSLEVQTATNQVAVQPVNDNQPDDDSNNDNTQSDGGGTSPSGVDTPKTPALTSSVEAVTLPRFPPNTPA